MTDRILNTLLNYFLDFIPSVNWAGETEYDIVMKKKERNAINNQRYRPNKFTAVILDI